MGSDRIAARGMRFLQGYANSAVCSATRLALITGRYQYRLRLGARGAVASDGKQLMPDDNRDLCEICWSPLQTSMKKVHDEAREKRNS
jgi:arylsulfatase A-like enzyme